MNRVTVEVTSADLPGFLDAMLVWGISGEDIRASGPLTLELTLEERDYSSLEALARKRGEGIRILAKRGWLPRGRTLARHWLLLLGLTALLVLSLVLPSRIWFIRVTGNDQIPRRQILAMAEAAGLGFGTSRRSIRSEALKNALLEAIPQLQWVGVNTRGCVAVISVRERSLALPAEEGADTTALVAARDGVITRCTVTAGVGRCQVGQAVREGEVLVSGQVSDTLHVRARGEIEAVTRRVFRALTPTQVCRRGNMTGISRKFSLLIGKKRINFSKDSGILPATCDKMYVYHYATLPGGFTLPLALVEEIRYDYETTTVQLTQEEGEVLLKDYARWFLCRDMTDGTVVTAAEAVGPGAGAYRLLGVYGCRERIDRETEEEMEWEYGENH